MPFIKLSTAHKMESGIFTVKDCFELVSYIATLIGVGALIFGVYSYKLTQIRSAWSEEEQKWYFSIIDVIEALTGSPRPRKYWNALKTKLTVEGSQLSHKLGQLKMLAEDGKMRDTDVADTESSPRSPQVFPPRFCS